MCCPGADPRVYLDIKVGVTWFWGGPLQVFQLLHQLIQDVHNSCGLSVRELVHRFAVKMFVTLFFYPQYLKKLGQSVPKTACRRREDSKVVQAQARRTWGASCCSQLVVQYSIVRWLGLGQGTSSINAKFSTIGNKQSRQSCSKWITGNESIVRNTLPWRDSWQNYFLETTIIRIHGVSESSLIPMADTYKIVSMSPTFPPRHEKMSVFKGKLPLQSST